MGGNRIENYRNSRVEFLKIIAMVLIVICHVIAELNNNSYIEDSDFLISWNSPSEGRSHVVLTILHQSGYLGNTIFFVCSAWFFLDTKSVNIKKIIQLLLDIEVISLIAVAFYCLIARGNTNYDLALKMLFPHTNRLFWYLTCYILFYLIHGHLNVIIQSMSRNNLKIAAVLWSIYIIYGFFTRWYFTHVLVSWVALYFVLAYIKTYLRTMFNNRINVGLLIFGLLGSAAIPMLINVIAINSENSAIRLSYFDDISRWNPFHVVIAIALMNIALNAREQYNYFINFVASLSPLVFLFHSNRTMREYLIPSIWGNFGASGGISIVQYAMVFGVVLYVIALILSIIYRIGIQKITARLSTKISAWLMNFSKVGI